MSNETPPNYIELAADIVSAFVSNNSVSVADLPNLIGNVHTALRNRASLLATGRGEANPCRFHQEINHSRLFDQPGRRETL